MRRPPRTAYLFRSGLSLCKRSRDPPGHTDGLSPRDSPTGLVLPPTRVRGGLLAGGFAFWSAGEAKRETKRRPPPASQPVRACAPAPTGGLVKPERVGWTNPTRHPVRPAAGGRSRAARAAA